MCDRTGFYHVLSVFVVLSVSVESAMESNDVLMTLFLRCVFERYDAVCHVCATRRNRLWRPRKPLACGPKPCRFSRTSHDCLPTSCDGSAAGSAPSSADSSPVVGDGNVTTINKKSTFTHVPPVSLASAPPPCTHGRCGGCASMPDACRRFANTGDCAAWVNRNPTVDERCGTNALLITATDPQTRDTDDTPKHVRKT